MQPEFKISNEIETSTVLGPDPHVPHPANGEKQLLLNSKLEDL